MAIWWRAIPLRRGIFIISGGDENETPTSDNFIDTEAGDHLLTEGGDNLVTET